MILHHRLCVQTIDPGICTIHMYLAIFLSAGTLQMVSEHCVACRIETLGLDKKAHRTKEIAIRLKKIYYATGPLFYFTPSEIMQELAKWFWL